MRTLKVLIDIVAKIKDSLKSFVMMLIYTKLKVKIRQVKVQDSVCYILGNGPSLKNNLTEDLDQLRSQQLIVVNEFAKSEYYEILRPGYYVLSDPTFWNEKTNADDYKVGIQTLEQIGIKTTWPLQLLIPNDMYKKKQFRYFFDGNPCVTLINYNRTSITGFKTLSHFLYKHYMGMPPMQNVLNASVYLSINMGFKEINILGADHSWTKDLAVNDKNEVCIASDHFYSNTKNYIPFIHVFGEVYKMHRALRDFAQMFETYHLLKAYADHQGSRIYNCTPGSFIDAFERKKMEVIGDK